MRKTRMYIVFVLISVIFLWMLGITTRPHFVYYVTVEEIVATPHHVQGVLFRVQGSMVKNSLVSTNNTHTFCLKSAVTLSHCPLRVFYTGIMPDMSENIIAECTLVRENTVQCHTVMGQCPSKYTDTTTGD